MSELKGSICLLLVFGYNSYLHEARNFLVTLNKKFRNHYAIRFSSAPGHLEKVFKRENYILELDSIEDLKDSEEELLEMLELEEHAQSLEDEHEALLRIIERKQQRQRDRDLLKRSVEEYSKKPAGEFLAAIRSNRALLKLLSAP